jgi:hypothetical protein
MTPVGPALLLWAVDLGQGDGGFVSGGDTAQWRWGEVIAGPVSTGPVWGTNLEGPYLHDAEDWVEIELPDLSAAEQPSLVLTHWYAVREGDIAVAELDEGDGTFVRIDPAYGYPSPGGFVGQSLAYDDVVFDLATTAAAPKVRLTLRSDLGLSDLGWYLSDLELWDGDIVAPSLTVLAPPVDTQDLDGPYVVQAQVLENRGSADTTLWYSVNDGPAAAVSMLGSPTASAVIPGQPPDTTVDLWVESTDGQNLSRWPASGEHTFRVFLAAPGDPTAAVGEDHVVATQVALSWTPPDSPHPVTSYRVVHEGSTVPIVETTDTGVTVPLSADVNQRFQVLAEYDVGLSDPSAVLELDIEVPVLGGVDPSVVYPGTEVLIRLTGRSLYLVDGATTIALGEDLEVLSVDVVDVNEAVVSAHVVHGVFPGPRDVTVAGPRGTFVFPDALTVGHPEDLLRVDSVEPAELVQGTTTEVEIVANVPFGSDVRLSVDPDLAVVGVPIVDEERLTVRLQVEPAALLGPHWVAVDDGQGLAVAVVEVVEARSTLRTGCSSAGSVHPIAAIGALPWVLLAVRRRARAR